MSRHIRRSHPTNLHLGCELQIRAIGFALVICTILSIGCSTASRSSDGSSAYEAVVGAPLPDLGAKRDSTGEVYSGLVAERGSTGDPATDMPEEHESTGDPATDMSAELESTGDPQADLPADREAAGAVERFRAEHPGTLRPDRRFYSSREHFDRAYPDSFWHAYIDTLPTNEAGKLAWEASRWMTALVVMYQATGDAHYLHPVWRYAQTAMEMRDDRRGLSDSDGRSLAVWGSSKYVVGQRRHFLVHSALILEPMLELLLALRGELPMRQDPTDFAAQPSGLEEVSWAPREEQETLLRDCLETIDVYENRYRPGLDESEGFLLEDMSEWEPQPFNAQNILGYDMQLAYLLSGRELYHDRARAVMRFFANRLRTTEQDGYIWEYVAWPISPDRPIPLDQYRVQKCEEISHGFITIEAIPKMARLGVVFDRTDIERFARTLSRQIYQPKYRTFNTVIGCQPSYVPQYIGRLPGWLCVTEYDPEAYRIVEEFMLTNIERPDPLYLAYLIRFSPELSGTSPD